MTREQIRAFVATPKGKLLVACSLMVLSWVFLFFYFFSDTLSALGDPESLAKATTELKRAQAANAQISERYDELMEQKKRYKAVAAAAWRESRDGQVETVLRQKITEAVAQLAKYRADPFVPALAHGTTLHQVVFQFKGDDMVCCEQIAEEAM